MLVCVVCLCSWSLDLLEVAGFIRRQYPQHIEPVSRVPLLCFYLLVCALQLETAAENVV